MVKSHLIEIGVADHVKRYVALVYQNNMAALSPNNMLNGEPALLETLLDL
jgi:hypothetical protein